MRGRNAVSQARLIREALRSGEGILRLAPCWVPRRFLVPGGRLKLHPDDLYALGAARGGIDERWLASSTAADNGAGTPADEGLSSIDAQGQRVLLKEAIESIGDELVGADVMARHGGFDVLCKLFDNLGPIAHHLHPGDEHAGRVGRKGKPESYYYPPQYNFIANGFPHTFMGLEPGTTKADLRRCLERWQQGDNGILDLSRAFRLRPGTGWQIDTGVLHAPGSLVTYEPQAASDVGAVFQSMVDGRPLPWSQLVKDVPAESQHDLDYIIGMLDWEKNVDPAFGQHNRRIPRPVRPDAAIDDAGYREAWVSYGSAKFSAKELTVRPGQSVVINDAAAYGVILTRGRGRLNRLEVETPTMIRFGAMTADEVFVTAAAARAGVRVSNASAHENLVLLKHFGPGNPDAAALIRS
jgi:hypothetical protein